MSGPPRVHFLPYARRQSAPAGAMVIDVSSYGDDPWNRLSPMYPHGGIPIPGSPGKTSDSVEGIWQGLKVIRGKTAPRYFRGRGQKRGGKPSGHQYGEKLLKIVEARRRIYHVAYEWMVAHRAAAEVDALLEMARDGATLYIHDLANSGDPHRKHLPLAHASVLVGHLNRRLR